ncbi:MAG: methyltransferase [Myxococcota bacterium]
MIRLDEPAPGLLVAQPKRGFKYGAEAFWLAGFALEGARPSERTALDVGTGSGVIAALLARRGLQATGIDVRGEWTELWERTLGANDKVGALELLRADVREFKGRGFDIVVSNPPYFPLDAGPASPDPWKRAARSEVHGSLKSVLTAALACVAPEGRLCIVIPINRASVARELDAVVTRAVCVGKHRWLAELQRRGEVTPEVHVGEESDRVRRWYALARA